MVSIDEDMTVTLRRRIAAEYREMPGLALTLEQAERLWGCERRTCLRVVEILIKEGLLRWSRDGLLIRRS
jgi:hypothetical protein